MGSSLHRDHRTDRDKTDDEAQQSSRDGEVPHSSGATVMVNKRPIHILK